uniref:Uncharacterized protein n=1 Tax=viral metagenome TaxID=1070528 RepID=A0A6C0JMP0_9ZZZZ
MGGSQSNEYQPKYNPKEYTKRRPGQNIYGIYENAVYWRGKRVNGAHGLSFTDLGFGYGKDDKNVFYSGQKIETSGVDSFQVFINGYAKDDDDVLYDGNILHGADVESFRMNKDGTANDRQYKYSYGKRIGRKRRSRSRKR